MNNTLDKDMYLILGRLEGKLDSVMTITEKQWNTIEKHDARIKKLEKDRHTIYGAAAVLGVIGSIVIWVISNFVRNT
jgi:hypothetical protein